MYLHSLDPVRSGQRHGGAGVLRATGSPAAGRVHCVAVSRTRAPLAAPAATHRAPAP